VVEDTNPDGNCVLTPTLAKAQYLMGFLPRTKKKKKKKRESKSIFKYEHSYKIRSLIYGSVFIALIRDVRSVIGARVG